jgi:hypothetical protein
MTKKTETAAPEAAPTDAAAAADLAALTAAANEETAGTVAANEPEAGPPPMPLGEEFAALLKMLSGILAPAFPSLSEIYTDETCKGAGFAAGGVCEKHGWLTGGVMGDYAEEIAAAAILLPLGFATVQGVRGDIEARKAKAKKPDAAIAAPLEVPTPGRGGDGNPVVTIGNPPPKP